MTREAMSRGLEMLKKSMEEVEDQQKQATSFPRFHLTILHYLLTKARDEGQTYDEQTLASIEKTLAQFEAFEAKALYAKEKLEGLRTAVETDAACWEVERQTLHSAMGTVVNAQQLRGTELEPPAAKTESDARAVTRNTSFGVAGRYVLDARKEALNPTDEDGSRYQERLETTFAAFLDIVGDKPLDYYLPIHLQDFANVMARVPKNRTKYKIFDGLSLREMADKNDRSKMGTQKERLSASTITSHLSEIKSIWSQATAGVNGLAGLGSFKVTTPKAAAEPVDREALSVERLNIWLKSAASPRFMRKPWKAWLPVVGLLTGMRLAEIVFLQRTDFVIEDGNEVIDLRKPLTIRGNSVQRPLKGKTSKRIVALHPLLTELGFMEYVRTVRTVNGFIFPAFHQAKDPADAAQKQMGNWMIGLGIHEPYRQVFHSLRHNAKHWFRMNVGELMAGRQCGHAPGNVGEGYGFKCLEREEVLRIMSIPAPARLDFSPFRK